MRIGLCAWSFTRAHREAGAELDPYVPEDLVQLAAAHGLKSIECSSAALQAKSPAEVDAFQRVLQDHNMGIVLDVGSDSYHTDISPLTDAIETAGRFGATVVRTTVSKVLEGDRTAFGLQGWTEFLQSLVELLKRLMALAERTGIVVGIENHQDICSWELCWLCDQVGSPMLGSTLDVGNALAVGETPLAFANRVTPYLKHVHLKDYAVYTSSSGYRLKRCTIGDGVINWPEMFDLLGENAPDVVACIELGASATRHIRLLEEEFWECYPPRPPKETTDAIGMLHKASRPPEEDWRTPHERGESAASLAAYELAEFAQSVDYLKGIEEA